MNSFIERSPIHKTSSVVLNDEMSVTTLNSKLEADLDLDNYRRLITNLGSKIYLFALSDLDLKGEIRKIVLTSDDTHFLCAGSDKIIRVFEISTGSLIHEFTGIHQSNFIPYKVLTLTLRDHHGFKP